jgi:hypothetical protein
MKSEVRSMIEQVLSKTFLLNVLTKMEEAAKSPLRAGGRRSTKDAERLSQAETATVLEDLRKAREDAGEPVKRTRRMSSAAGPPSADEKVYIPASPELSNLQSAIEQYVFEHRPELLQRDPQTMTRRGKTTSVTGMRLKSSDRRLFGRFEVTDLRWINSLFAKGMTKFRGKHAFVPRPARETPISLPDEKLRLVIFGDWGSGIPRAQKVSKAIRRELDYGIAHGLQQHVIHVGECTTRAGNTSTGTGS